MNGMPAEYAVMLARKNWRVINYVDCKEDDSLSSPYLRFPGISNTPNLNIKFIGVKHPFWFLFPSRSRNLILADLRRADLCFLSGASISLASNLYKYPAKPVVALCYGDDITLLANKAWPFKRFLKHSFWPRLLYGWLVFLIHLWIVNRQKKGLACCSHAAYFPAGHDIIADKILSDASTRFGLIRLARHSISIDNLPTVKPTFLSRRPSRQKVLFPVRFSPADSISFDKGWKCFIDGAITFLSSYPLEKVEFYCFEKGPCVDDAKKIIFDSGLSDNFTWLNTVPFHELYSLFNDSDVVVDQLGNHVIGQGLWAALLGKPVITNIGNDIDRLKLEGSCVLHAANSLQFSEQLAVCLQPEFKFLAMQLNPKVILKHYSLEAEFNDWSLA
ncbi:hypothetical protein [Synechococcus sp. UW140]|uniref:hypothetical protein n=1 Tax=Synechococcus sp. UW140 TaxID=368503 RepID=UPI0031377CB6